MYGKETNQYYTHINFVVLYPSPKYPLLIPLIQHKTIIKNIWKDRLVKHACYINEVTWHFFK